MPSTFEILSIISIVPKLIVFLIYLIWMRRLYILSFKLPGPFWTPFFGNLHLLFFKRGTIFNRFNSIIQDNKDVFRFWIGHKLLVFVKNPDTVESILSLQEFCQTKLKKEKTDEKWRSHKKLIKPLLNAKVITDNVNILHNHLKICFQNLDKHIDQDLFDIYENIHLCVTDIMGDILLGDSIDAQIGKNGSFVAANETVRTIINKKRIFNWLHLKMFYYCSKYYRQNKRAKETQHYFIENVIRKSWQRRKMDVFGENNSNNILPVIDKIGDFVESNPNVIENEKFRDYLLNIFQESVNSISVTTAFACLCFGMYPEYQEKALAEIKSVIGDNITNLKYDDLIKLKFLEMCIYDVIRLASPKPYIFRNFAEDILIENITIPPQCTIVIPTYILHRDKNEYERPEHFYPDHFLPQNTKTRKPGASIIFGMGPKDCVGKIVSMVTIKIILISILQRYKIEADGTFPDLELSADLYTKPIKGYNLRLKSRNHVERY